MSSLQSITDSIIIFALGTYLLMAIGLLTRPLRFRNGTLSLVLFALAFLHFFMYLVYSNKILAYPHFFGIHAPVLMATGPLIYFYIQNISGEKESMERKDWLHFAAALIVLVLFLPFIIKSGDEKRELLTKLFLNEEFMLTRIPGILGLVHFFFYIIFAMRKILLRVKQGNPAQGKIIILIGLLFMWLVCVVLAAVNIVIIDFTLMKYNILFESFMLFTLYCMSQRYPFLLRAGTARKPKKDYARSYLDNVNQENLERQLKLIMEDEKFYCDEDITLAKLSEALELTPRQLSQFINKHYGKNFSNYINTYRVVESKKLLIEDFQQNTLSIAYAVGFNSYTAFYSAFKKDMNMSPADFRRSK
ncbi:MAG: AraC family transcriptional regulator [bacterium]|nr:AraC family transcriptional regulator [bacterium]